MSGADRGTSVLAVDIGGTKVAAARVTSDGRIVSRRREMIAPGGPPAVVDQITRLLRDLLDIPGNEASVAVGIGLPAVLEQGTDLVIWAPNLPGFRNVPLRELLQASIGLPVYLENDGHTAVLGEWWQGAGRNSSNVVAVTIGTGIGGGMILDGKLYRGHDRLAGAIGWSSLTTEISEESSARVYGHWEMLAAGPGIARRAWAGLEAGRSSTLTPTSLTAERVFDAARAGDAFAQEVVFESARLIGIGVANIVSLLNPDVVVLGGGVGSQADLILDTVRQVVRDVAQPASGRSAHIESSHLGDDAGILGAAFAAFERGRV